MLKQAMVALRKKRNQQIDVTVPREVVTQCRPEQLQFLNLPTRTKIGKGSLGQIYIGKFHGDDLGYHWKFTLLPNAYADLWTRLQRLQLRRQLFHERLRRADRFVLDHDADDGFGAAGANDDTAVAV